MPTSPEQALYEYLSTFLTDNKRQKFKQAADRRTRYLTVVVEDIYQAQNASAVVRTCDCFGVQDIHVIENHNEYKINKDVVKGASKWVDLHKYETSAEAAAKLKEEGYRLVATMPGDTSLPLEELPLDQKTALIFGTELSGISRKVAAAADMNVHIPMFGFTESFNISVSAGICLHYLVNKLHASDWPWQLADAEKNQLLIEWARKMLRRADILEKEFWERWESEKGK